ncbi:hypothetical protein CPB97_000745 [Podila verticillata]|nr:hypothetical protein CPB97_000745 [Podila verticillata]
MTSIENTPTANEGTIGTAAQRTLNIAEIRLQVSSYLNPVAVASCALVSRSWHHTFTPRLWESISLCGRSVHQVSSDNHPIFEQHVHLIRHLRMNIFSINSLALPFALHCRHLTSLTLSIAGDEVTSPSVIQERWVQFGLLLSHNPGLQSFDVSSLPMGPAHIELWQGLANCPALTSLSCRNIDMTSSTQEACQLFAQICARLDSLAWLQGNSSSIVTLDPTLLGLTFPRLRSLRLEGTGPIECEILWRSCTPILESLQWASKGRGFHAPAASQNTMIGGLLLHLSSHDTASSSDKLGSLQSLDIQYLHAMSDQHIATLLLMIKRPLKRLTCRGTQFGGRAFRQLFGWHVAAYPIAQYALPSTSVTMDATADTFVHGHQLLTLQELDLTACQAVTSAMVQHVLMSCSGLVHICAHQLSALDVYEAQKQLKQGGPTWACRGLRRFGVRIVEAVGQASYVSSFVSTLSTHTNNLTAGQIAFLTEEAVARHCQAVFQELAQLTELEVLRVGSDTPRSDRGLRMNTGMGLKYLCGLGSLSSSSGRDATGGASVMRRLKVLDVSNMGQVMNEDDVEWIVRQFGGQLTEVRGELHKDTRQNRMLKQMFPKGILCSSGNHSFQYLM